MKPDSDVHSPFSVISAHRSGINTVTKSHVVPTASQSTRAQLYKNLSSYNIHSFYVINSSFSDTSLIGALRHSTVVDLQIFSYTLKSSQTFRYYLNEKHSMLFVSEALLATLSSIWHSFTHPCIFYSHKPIRCPSHSAQRW